MDFAKGRDPTDDPMEWNASSGSRTHHRGHSLPSNADHREFQIASFDLRFNQQTASRPEGLRPLLDRNLIDGALTQMVLAPGEWLGIEQFRQGGCETFQGVGVGQGDGQLRPTVFVLVDAIGQAFGQRLDRFVTGCLIAGCRD